MHFFLYFFVLNADAFYSFAVITIEIVKYVLSFLVDQTHEFFLLFYLDIQVYVQIFELIELCLKISLLFQVLW